MSGKKQNNSKTTPVHTVRCGEVMAEIYARQSNAGFAYLDFSLGRRWSSMASGKEAHGSTFFEKNEQDLIRTVQEACAWVRTKMRGSLAQDALTEQVAEAD